jgi:hypothetical protein
MGLYNCCLLLLLSRSGTLCARFRTTDAKLLSVGTEYEGSHKDSAEDVYRVQHKNAVREARYESDDLLIN